MKYETVKEAAERLGVTARTVQKWAAAGKIPGAMKAGRDWQIPVQKEEGAKKSTGRKHIPMPLLNSAFPLGQCTRYIEKMEDEDERNIAWAEYYYFSGQAEKAAEAVELYLNSPDDALRYSAAWIYAFSNLTCDKTALTKYSIGNYKKGPAGAGGRGRSAGTESHPGIYLYGGYGIAASDYGGCGAVGRIS